MLTFVVEEELARRKNRRVCARNQSRTELSPLRLQHPDLISERKGEPEK